MKLLNIYYLLVYNFLPFCISSALRAADLGFLLRVKCLGSGGWEPTMATSADLFKYRHSRGRKLDPLSGRFATKKNDIACCMSNDKQCNKVYVHLITNLPFPSQLGTNIGLAQHKTDPYTKPLYYVETMIAKANRSL